MPHIPPSPLVPGTPAVRLAGALAAALIAIAAPHAAGAQARGDTAATVTVHVRDAEGAPVSAATVRSGAGGALTDAAGAAVLRLAPGPHTVVAARLGFQPDSLLITLRPAVDTAVTLVLAERAAALAGVVVSATRSERRVEDTPLRVEVIEPEEIAEKVAMTPGDVAMMLNESPGLRVQPTAPSLGGASVRVQGLRGRYTLVLADGLPLYGSAGGIGLLQIPPVDLGRVEVIKGTAAALYGGAALGGVINLVSRRPPPAGEPAERELLVNQTSRGGTDVVAFGGAPLGRGWGYTVIAGAHRQSRTDVDGDGWADLAGYDRAVARPRVAWNGGEGRSAFLTAGYTTEDRTGGTLGGGVASDGRPFGEGLRTRRSDAGGLARLVIGGGPLAGAIVTARGSAMEQRHEHRFGERREDDRHRTAFVEATLAAPRAGVTWVAGAAFQHEAYSAADVPGFDYAYDVPALFAQADVDPAAWLAISASVRADRHDRYGTWVNPRLSALVRAPAGALEGWTARLSAGTGSAAPTPLVEEAEATGLTPLAPLGDLEPERALSASLDVGGSIGTVEINGTLFGSRVRHPLLLREAVPGSAAPGSLVLANAARPTRTSGAEVYARSELGELWGGEVGLLTSYVHLRGTEDDPDASPSGAARRPIPLAPRHAAGFDAIWEREGRGRVGLELFYTGRQALDDDPYLSESRPYLLVGLLGEWRVGRVRLFANGENLGNVRQTRYAPFIRPSLGPGGRHTTDAWAPLDGRVVNAGVRVDVGPRRGED